MFGKAFVAIAFAAIAYAQEPTIESPSSLTQCVPTLIKWAGGTAPYFISIIPGNQPSAAAIKDFGQQSGTQLTWTVDIAAGTSVTYKIVDSGGQTNYNSAVTINPGSDSCLNGASASSGAASGTAAAGGAVSAASASASSAVGGASSAAASATSAAASSAAGVASSARSMASSAASGAMASASSVRSAAASAVSGASASAASAATTSNAASPFAVADIKTGALAVFLGAMGLAAF